VSITGLFINVEGFYCTTNKHKQNWTLTQACQRWRRLTRLTNCDWYLLGFQSICWQWLYHDDTGDAQKSAVFLGPYAVQRKVAVRPSCQKCLDLCHFYWLRCWTEIRDRIIVVFTNHDGNLYHTSVHWVPMMTTDWLTVHRDQLRAQRSATSMGELHLTFLVSS